MTPVERAARAAEGFREPRMPDEAWEELESLEPDLRANPDVLALRVRIYLAKGMPAPAAIVALGLVRVVPWSMPARELATEPMEKGAAWTPRWRCSRGGATWAGLSDKLPKFTPMVAPRAAGTDARMIATRVREGERFMVARHSAPPRGTQQRLSRFSSRPRPPAVTATPQDPARATVSLCAGKGRAAGVTA